MSAGLLALSAGRRTSDPLLTAYITAQRINHLTGASIAPWEVAELPEEWVDAARGLAVDLPRLGQARQEAASVVERLRKEHRERNGTKHA